MVFAGAVATAHHNKIAFRVFGEVSGHFKMLFQFRRVGVKVLERGVPIFRLESCLAKPDFPFNPYYLAFFSYIRRGKDS